MRHIGKFVATLGLAFGLSNAAAAAVVYNEGVNGDLADSFSSPTGISIASPGANQVIGTLTNPGPALANVNRDYFTITIPFGYTLQSLILTNFTKTVGNLGFLAIASGATAPDPTTPAAQLPALLVGYTHLSTTLVGTDILPLIGHAAGATGFSQTLVAGTYTFWLQDTSVNTVDDFTITLNVAIPEPASALLFGASLAGLGWARRRRRALPAG